MKSCNKCLKVKELIAFSKGNDKDGYQYKCKKCNAEYRKINDKKLKSYFKARYNSRKDEFKITRKENYPKHKEKINLRNRIYWRKNYKLKLKAMQLKYQQSHPEKIKQYAKKYTENNRGKLNSRAAKRRCLKLQRTPKWLTVEDHLKIQEFYVFAKLMTDTLGIPFEVDHIIPLKGRHISGLHIPTNLQIITESENLRKSNKYDIK